MYIVPGCSPSSDEIWTLRLMAAGGLEKLLIINFRNTVANGN